MSLLGSSLESSSCSFVPCPCMCLISTLSGVWVQPRLRMQHRSLCETPSVNMSAVPKWLLLQSMMFTKPGRKAVSYFSPLPTSFLESPATSLALQTEMIGRLCSQDGRQGLLVHWLSPWTGPWVGHCTLRMSPLLASALPDGPPGRLSHLAEKAQQSWADGSVGKAPTGQV